MPVRPRAFSDNPAQCTTATSEQTVKRRSYHGQGTSERSSKTSRRDSATGSTSSSKPVLSTPVKPSTSSTTTQRSRDSENELASSWFDAGAIVLVEMDELFRDIGIASDTLHRHIQQARSVFESLSPSEQSRFEDGFRSESRSKNERRKDWLPDLAKLVC